MIQFDTDGVTLFYIDTAGNKVSAKWSDGIQYTKMLGIRSAQLVANQSNQQEAANYNSLLSTAQACANAGQPYTTPAKPNMTVVDDATGTPTQVPFVPPLPDLVVPSTSTAPTATMLQTFAAAKAATPSTDSLVLDTHNMVAAIFNKMFPGS